MLAIADSMTSPNWHIALDGRHAKWCLLMSLPIPSDAHLPTSGIAHQQPALYIVVQTAQGATCANAHYVDFVLPQMASCRYSACHANFCALDCC